MDYWVYNLSTYFKAFPKFTEEEKLHISSLQLEDISQSWCDTHSANPTMVVELDDHAQVYLSFDT